MSTLRVNSIGSQDKSGSSSNYRFQTQFIINNADVGGTTINTTSFTEVDTNMRISITPSYIDSLLLIKYHFLFGGGNSTLVRHFKIRNVTTSTDVDLSHSAQGSKTNLHASHRNQDADENDVDMLTVEAAEVSGSTTARTYGLFFKIESGSDDSFFNHTVTDTAAVGYAKPMITIHEMSK